MEEDGMADIERCGTCGQRVEVVTAEKKIGLIAEGTSYYRGADGAEVASLREQLREAVEALAQIHDKAKYLAESAWNEEGTRLVGERIMRLASPHVGGQ
jgi:hypothetical protein